MSTVGAFCVVKNELLWIRAHLLSWLPWVDEMVFFDSSTDGTTDIIKDVRKSHPFGKRITLVEGRDCKDLRDDYVALFNECLHTLKTDYAAFIHPDMILDEPGNLGSLGAYHAYTMNMRSFGGDPDGPLFEILGRGQKWKNIYRLKNPDMGLHYYGHYGAVNEDCYFKEITGKEHIHFGQDFTRYPYRVGDSWVKVLHYSDVRPIERRIGRMVSCLINQGYSKKQAEEIAKDHPRVTLNGDGLGFLRAEYHPLFKEGVNA